MGGCPYEADVLDQLSISEKNGLKLLSEQDLKIYSIGISTAGAAEKMMALGHPKRKIVSTTIDQKGRTFAENFFQQTGLSSQVIVKLEDISQPLPYEDEAYDFIYARLVLHYLPKASLEAALKEMHRILKRKGKGKLFVVVRSDACEEIKEHFVEYDLSTCMTTYESRGNLVQRYFHTQKSLSQYLMNSGFDLQSMKMYDEQLNCDFYRKISSSYIDTLIEAVSIKVHEKSEI